RSSRRRRVAREGDGRCARAGDRQDVPSLSAPPEEAEDRAAEEPRARVIPHATSSILGRGGSLMSTWSTRYVRLRDREADLARLRQTLGAAASNLVTDPSSSFASIFLATPSLEPDDLGDLSKTFGEAFSIQVHSMADLVIYDHFADGARRRGL